MGRSRGGLTTKIHAVTDAKGLPIRLAVTPGRDPGASAVADVLGMPRSRVARMSGASNERAGARRVVRLVARQDRFAGKVSAVGDGSHSGVGKSKDILGNGITDLLC